MLSNFGLQFTAFSGSHDESADLAITFQHAHGGCFVFAASPGNHFAPFGSMHISGVAADKRFINLNAIAIAAHLNESAALHRKPNTMRHEPRGFLGNAKISADLIGTHAIFATGKQPYCGKPLIQTKRRILEYSSDLNGKLAMRMYALALPFSLIGQKYNILPAAKWDK